MFCVYECGGYCVRMDAPYIRCGVDSCEYSYPQKQTTNADHIRSMTDEELGQFLGEWAEKHRFWMCDGTGECLGWLKGPYKEGKR